MHLDTPTVAFITVLVVCLESGILTALWVIHRGMRGVGHWAAGALVISVGVLGVYLRSDALPSASLVVANLFIIGGYVLTWWGIEAFFERPLPYRFGIAILVVAAVALSYFTATDNSRIRIVVLLACFALLSALRIYSMLRDVRPSTRFSQVLASLALGIHAIYFLALATAIWTLPPVERPLAQVPISGWLFLIPMLLSIAVIFTAILLINQTIAARLQEAARRDALTDALTRRALEEVAETEIARSRRHQTPLSLLLLDIDHFKLVNDQYGHAAGDAALRQFAAAARRCLRREDIFGRLGGEEFCALLPNTAVAGAAQLAERIRQSVADLAVDAGGHRLSLKVSIGVASLGSHGNTWHELVHQADTAMYAAKRAGRNRVIVGGGQTAAAPVA
ncbi:MAG: GGDEF domain-containing protein [Ferrovibrio sp.]|uniref:GGDEF domain-containing protein n=1 Tax=Ferrovibrio sp. TaxID=1917215 RepID=UPI002632B7BE|nr:GGDEF domain-containing protein [Ferrovibrio sp.]MCW0233254.1 GGDEF domain-containing protein [Ferrovibrio sp.]